MRHTILLLFTFLSWHHLPGPLKSNAADPEDESAVWPISRSSEPDTRFVVFPYGPRNIGHYNFHAGIDIYVKRGTPVGSILPGRVLYTNDSTVLIQHSRQRKSAYLHLNRVDVSKGDSVKSGDIVGTVGDTKAKDVHLHLTYLVGPKKFIDEVESRNPLEALPHREPAKPTVNFEGNAAIITLDAGLMTARRITLVYADSTELSIDYEEIVKQGRKQRNDQIQSGIKVEASRPRKLENQIRVFDLTLEAENPERILKKLILEDIDGRNLLDVEKPK